MPNFDERPLGALPRPGGGVQFRVWSPEADGMTLVLETNGAGGEPERRAMQRAGSGYFELRAKDLAPGARYWIETDDAPEPVPDPAARFQPEGVHGPSEVVDPRAYDWQATGWHGVAQRDLVFYELHVGTFTEAGTFEAAIERLDHLAALGVTAVELMPVHAFPGTRGWGYDPAAFFAPEATYGRPDDLRRLVDAIHQRGMAAFLDVVYNHLGPDGAYLAGLMPVFTDRHETPWGQAVNLDDRHSEGVRHFFIENVLHWLAGYRFDGLRLDATGALVDDSDPHFLEEMAARVEQRFEGDGPRRLLIAEDERNARHLVEPRSEDGYGLDGVWADDFHHQMRNLTAGDELFYFSDFTDTTAAEIAETLRQGWFYTGQYAPNFGAERGTPTDGLPPERFVICIQNHDQVGNRPAGARLTDDIAPPLYRAATAMLLFAPELPLLFMGQEWAAATPFQFFTDHHDELGEKVSEGRKEEFAEFADLVDDEVPDPQAEATFERSKLDWAEQERMPHAGVLALYRALLDLRQALPHASPDREGFTAEAHGPHGLALQRGDYTLLAALGNGISLPLPGGRNAEKVLSTEELAYTGSPRQLRRENGTVRFERPGALVVRAS